MAQKKRIRHDPGSDQARDSRLISRSRGRVREPMFIAHTMPPRGPFLAHQMQPRDRGSDIFKFARKSISRPRGKQIEGPKFLAQPRFRGSIAAVPPAAPAVRPKAMVRQPPTIEASTEERKPQKDSKSTKASDTDNTDAFEEQIFISDRADIGWASHISPGELWR